MVGRLCHTNTLPIAGESSRLHCTIGVDDELAHNDFDNSDGEVSVNFESNCVAASPLQDLPPQVHHPGHLQQAVDQVEGGGMEEIAIRGDFACAGF